MENTTAFLDVYNRRLQEDSEHKGFTRNKAGIDKKNDDIDGSAEMLQFLILKNLLKGDLPEKIVSELSAGKTTEVSFKLGADKSGENKVTSGLLGDLNQSKNNYLNLVKLKQLLSSLEKKNNGSTGNTDITSLQRMVDTLSGVKGISENEEMTLKAVNNYLRRLTDNEVNIGNSDTSGEKLINSLIADSRGEFVSDLNKIDKSLADKLTQYSDKELNDLLRKTDILSKMILKGDQNYLFNVDNSQNAHLDLLKTASSSDSKIYYQISAEGERDTDTQKYAGSGKDSLNNRKQYFLNKESRPLNNPVKNQVKSPVKNIDKKRNSSSQTTLEENEKIVLSKSLKNNGSVSITENSIKDNSTVPLTERGRSVSEKINPELTDNTTENRLSSKKSIPSKNNEVNKALDNLKTAIGKEQSDEKAADNARVLGLQKEESTVLKKLIRILSDFESKTQQQASNKKADNSTYQAKLLQHQLLNGKQKISDKQSRGDTITFKFPGNSTDLSKNSIKYGNDGGGLNSKGENASHPGKGLAELFNGERQNTISAEGEDSNSGSGLNYRSNNGPAISKNTKIPETPENKLFAEELQFSSKDKKDKNVKGLNSLEHLASNENGGIARKVAKGKIKQNQVKQADVYKQIEKNLNSLQRIGKNRMVLQLEPESLGKVKLNISVKDGSVTIQFRVDNNLVKHELEQNMHLLKNNFIKQGYNVDHIQVETDNHDTAFQQQTGSENHSQNHNSGQQGRQNSEYENMTPEEIYEMFQQEEEDELDVFSSFRRNYGNEQRINYFA